jgi:hypothetical protein
MMAAKNCIEMPYGKNQCKVTSTELPINKNSVNKRNSPMNKHFHDIKYKKEGKAMIALLPLLIFF